jgi:multiple sugar transport system permease protein
MINRSFRNPCRFAGPETDGSQYCFTAGPSQNSFELSPFLNLIPFFNLDPNAFSLQGYDIVINSQTSNLGQALVNGFILSGLTAIIVVIIGSLVAVVLSKYHFRGENYIVLIIFSMSSLPPIIILIPYYIQISILKGFGIDIFGFENPFYSPANGHFLSLLLPYVAFNFPLGVFLIRSFFTNIPDDLIKAAKVDGASNFQIFRKILIPLTRPGIFTTALMVFIQAWNELLFARLFLLGENDSQTVPLALLKFLLNPSALTGVPWIPELILATGSVIATVPLIILVLILQRYIIAGITSGAVKG